MENEDNVDKIFWTREKIVNFIAVGMSLAFVGFLIPILLFPVVPKRKIYLRPWDDNIEKVISSAIRVSEEATRANWAMELFAKQSDWLATLRRWDDTLKHKDTLSQEDSARPWSNYENDEDDWKEKQESKKKRKWDNDVLEKVDQDWEPIDRKFHREAIRYRDVDEILERGKVEPEDNAVEESIKNEIQIGNEKLAFSRKDKNMR